MHKNDKNDKWLYDYAARMLKHEAKVLGKEPSKTCLIAKLCDDNGIAAVLDALPEKLSRGSNEDEVDIDTTNRAVVMAIKDLINYDGRLAHSVQLRDLVRAASSEVDSSSMSIASTGVDDIGSAAGATAMPSSARKRFSIKDDISTQCVHQHPRFVLSTTKGSKNSHTPSLSQSTIFASMRLIAIVPKRVCIAMARLWCVCFITTSNTRS